MKNRIHMLLNSRGNEQFSKGSKGHIAADYFREMFTSSNPGDLDALFANICTVHYKVIFKILYARPKLILPDIV